MKNILPVLRRPSLTRTFNKNICNVLGPLPLLLGLLLGLALGDAGVRQQVPLMPLQCLTLNICYVQCFDFSPFRMRWVWKQKETLMQIVKCELSLQHEQ
jgi:hypothetical protein